MPLSSNRINLLGYGKVGQEQAIDDVLSELIERRTRIDLITVHSIMDAYISCNNMMKSVSLFRLLFPEIYLYISAAPSLSFLGDNAAKLQLICKDIKPNTRTLNILLKAFRDLSKSPTNSLQQSVFDSSQAILREMTRVKVQPDSITINTLLDIAVSEGKYDKAEQVSI